MTDVGSDETTAILSGAAHAEAEYGSTFPGLYAILAQEHMRAYGTTRQQLSAVAVQNHAHALQNPKAQYHKALTEEMVSTSTMIAEPLRLLDCSPITDGAAAVVLTTVGASELASPAVGSASAAPTEAFPQIIGFGHGQESITLAGRASLTEFASTRAAAQQAYAMAGLRAADIAVAEVHDCFTIAEILAVEDLGFARKGAAAAALADGTLPVLINPSGGLKGCGHPVGATGVKQLAYLAEHLTDGQVGLAHNVGGSGATAVVHIVR
jgi:acetyl-CoA C-acetyltransferase